MRSRRLALVLGALILLCAAVPAASSASTFCVQRPDCAGTPEPDLQSAGVAAFSSPGPDTILIGSGTFEGTVGDYGQPLTIEGTGPKTLLSKRTSTDGDTVVHLGNADSVVRRLSVRLTASTPDLRVAGIDSSGAGTAEDVRVAAPIGIQRVTTIRRARIAATAYDIVGARVVSDSLLRVVGNGIGLYTDNCDYGGPVTAQNLTIAGDGAGMGTGVLTVEQGSGRPCGGAAGSMDVRNSIITGLRTAVSRRGNTTDPAAKGADLHVGYSNYDPAATVDTGPGTLTTDHNGNVDPRFVDAATGDFRLRFNSPLIDKAGPRPFDAGAFDVDGRPRTVDGNRTGSAVTDIGASEYQHAGPVALFAAQPLTVAPRAAVAFDATRSSDADGGALRFTWRCGDGTSASGAQVRHAYVHPGAFRAFLTVTDDAGLTDVTSRVIRVLLNCKVPNLKGHSVRVSRRLIARGHCTVGRITSRRSNARRGNVVAQSPSRPGRIKPPRTRINLVLSRGRPL